MANEERRILAARRIAEGRRHRGDLFPEEMFADAAWSMLLTAFICQSEQQPAHAQRIYQDCGVTPAVGQRWLNYLEQQGLIDTGDNPAARIVKLTSDALNRLHRYLDDVIALAEGRQIV